MRLEWAKIDKLLQLIGNGRNSIFIILCYSHQTSSVSLYEMLTGIFCNPNIRKNMAPDI